MKDARVSSSKTIGARVMRQAEDLLQRAQELAQTSMGPEEKALLNDWLKLAEEVWSLKYKAAPTLLGTALLARALWEDSDPFSLKLIKGDSRTYSARSLAHNVLLPFAVRHGLKLKGVGREPLNNQPFFRYNSVRDIERAKYREDIARLQSVLSEVQKLSSEQALVALAAFLQFSRSQERRYASPPLLKSDRERLDFLRLIKSTKELLARFPEGGKSAQAVAAAGIRAMYPYSQVKVLSRVNDPGRHYPGDVVLIDEAGAVVLAVEARGKPVSIADALIFARQAAEDGVRKALILDLVSDKEHLSFNPDALQQYGVVLMEVSGTSVFVHLVIELSPLSKEGAARLFLNHLLEELHGLEVGIEAQRYLVESIKNKQVE